MSEELKRKLRDARGQTGDTQKQFASRLGVPYRTLVNWENDLATPGFLARMALEAKLNEILKK